MGIELNTRATSVPLHQDNVNLTSSTAPATEVQQASIQDAEDAKVSQRTQKKLFEFHFANSASLCVLCVRFFYCVCQRRRGLSASRNQSPSRLTDSAISTSMAPGKIVIHHSPENR